MLLGTIWNKQERPLYIAVFLYISYYILRFIGVTSALKSLGSDTIPVRARSAAPQRWESESVLSSLFFVRASLFGSVYSINEFFRPVNRAGKIFPLKQYEKGCPIEGQPFCVKLIPAARKRGAAIARLPYEICTRRSERGRERPAACGGRTYSLTAPADIPLTIYFTRQK